MLNKPPRNLHTQIKVGKTEKLICKSLRSNRGRPWSTGLAGITDYRDWLLREQKHRCAYCQVPITSIRAGHCEIDHILPKESSAYIALNRVQAKSDKFEHRRHTMGYPAFRYVPENLAVACKQCNSSKGSYDGRIGRVRTTRRFPRAAYQYLWVHPHFHDYSAHVVIDVDWIYEGQTEEGRRTIEVCGLNKAEVVARKRDAEALYAQSSGIQDFLIKYGAQFENIGSSQGMKILEHEYGLSEILAAEITACWERASFSRTAESFARALRTCLELLSADSQCSTQEADVRITF
jgi:hypothetical protein